MTPPMMRYQPVKRQSNILGKNPMHADVFARLRNGQAQAGGRAPLSADGAAQDSTICNFHFNNSVIRDNQVLLSIM